jgi:hypothetical protein
MFLLNKAIRRYALTLVICLAACSQAAAQSKIPPFNPPKIYTPKRMDLYTSYCGLWRTDRTYNSTIRLSNQLAISAMDATVTLFLSDGTPYVLPPVHLEKSGVETVDIAAALAGAPAAIKTHLSTFGSASVSYRYDWQGVVYAFMSILDTARSLEYTYPFMFPMQEQMGMRTPPGAPPSTTYEGLHWGYSAQSSVFLSFSNTTKQPLDISVSMLDGKGAVTMAQSMVVAPSNTELLTGLPTSTTPGGVQVTWNGDENALAVLGGIEDAKYGLFGRYPVLHGSPDDDQERSRRPDYCANDLRQSRYHGRYAGPHDGLSSRLDLSALRLFSQHQRAANEAVGACRVCEGIDSAVGYDRSAAFLAVAAA